MSYELSVANSRITALKERIAELEARILALETVTDEYLKGLEAKAYAAWKPMQALRSDEQVRDDDVRKELLDDLLVDARAALSIRRGE